MYTSLPGFLSFTPRGELTGTVQQASFDPPTGVSTTLSKPTEIYMGTITGDTIFFKVDSPGKHEQRTVTFTGSVEGDKIFFQRTPKVFREGDPGLNGVYRINGARQFTAVRVAPKSGRLFVLVLSSLQVFPA